MNRPLAAAVLLILASSPFHTTVPRAMADIIAARTLEAADAAYRGEDWARTAEMYRALAQENPAQGAFWYRLATAEYNRKQYAEAITHYERAIAVGFGVGNSYYNIACCRALLGESKPAVDALDLAIRHGLRNRERYIREDADFNAIRDTPEFRKRILPSVEGLSRTDGWRVDLEYLTRRVAETHYDPFRHITRPEWDAEIARISQAIPKLKDHEVVVAVMQLMVRINDGHTVAYPPDEGPLAFHSLPLDFYDFDDGLYIRRAERRYAGLVGKKLVRVGNVPANEALERVASVVPRDNSQGIRWIGVWCLGVVEVLHALGITPGLDAVEITVADADGTESRATVVATPLRSLHHASHADPDWVDMAEPVSELPRWRRHLEKNYWFELLPESGILYAGFHRVINQDDESLAEFAQRLFAFIDSNPVNVLVVDVRLNNGGNNTLARSLTLKIAGSEKINQRGHLFVITGRQTFSACQNFCNWLDRDSNVLFVGEPTGSKPNFVGEDNVIVLPYSGLTASASSRLWQDSFSEDERHWIAPHFAAEMTADDYRKNRDPAMDAILEYLAAQTAAPGR